MIIEQRITVGDLIAGLGLLVTAILFWQARTQDRQEFLSRIAVMEGRVADLWAWFMGDKRTRERIGRALDERDERNGGSH